MFGLSTLAVWWLRLGIDLERIKPGNPQQNGRHERMHLTLKNETTKPASFNFLQQQASASMTSSGVYNHDRPHQALGGSIRVKSIHRHPASTAAPEPDYPFHDRTVRVTQCGRICMGKRKINLSPVLLDRRWASARSTTRSGRSALWSMIWDTSIEDEGRIEPAVNPFLPKVLPIFAASARCAAVANRPRSSAEARSRSASSRQPRWSG